MRGKGRSRDEREGVGKEKGGQRKGETRRREEKGGMNERGRQFGRRMCNNCLYFLMRQEK